MQPERKSLVIQDYDSAWPQEFQRLKAMQWPYVADHAADIVHFGSTAVPGLAAKPIIDLAIVIRDYASFVAVKSALEALKYLHEGDLGIPGREAFKGEPKTDFMAHHLYVCTVNAPSHLKHLAFRDYLRNHRETARAYTALKRRLANECDGDRERYTSGKTAFINGILALT